MLKKITLLFIGAAMAGTTAYAQHMDTAKMYGWFKRDVVGAAQIQVTYRKGNTLPLNQDLGRAGIPPVSSNDVWINLSMIHDYHHWIWEDGLGFTPVSSSSVNNLNAHYNQYQAYFRMGYDVSQSTDFRLYPFIGANFSAAILNIQDKARTENITDFTQELTNSTSSKNFYQPNFGVEFGGGFDYLIKLSPKKIDDCVTVERNIPIGIRAGYYLNTYASGWRIDENYGLSGSPNPKQSAFFVGINIGFGYSVKR